MVESHQQSLFNERRMNFKCAKTRTYTSGKPRAHIRVDHEATPINTLGESLVTNGLPSSPKHIPTSGVFSVQTVFFLAFSLNFEPKRRTQSDRFSVIVSVHCNSDGKFSGRFPWPGCKFVL